MGTSTSGSGGKSGSPLDPEWLEGAEGSTQESLGGSDEVTGNQSEELAGEGADESGTADTPGDESGEAPGVSSPVGDKRFADARTKMTAYLQGGNRADLRGAVSSMVKKGMGGSQRAARTMRATASGAGSIGQFLADVRNGSTTRALNWVQRVRSEGLTANDLVLEIVREVLPDTGSIDDESLRNAAVDALTELYESFNDVDLLNLTDEQIVMVMGATIANEICNRVDMQLGQTYEKLKYDASQIQHYRNDMREWVHAQVREVMRGFDIATLNPQQLAQTVLSSALEVFAAP